MCSGSLKTTDLTLKLEVSETVKAYVIAHTLKDTLISNLSYELINTNELDKICINDNSIIN